MTTLEAVIEIGSTGVRLLVAQITENGTWSVIDRSELPVSLGWDVFTSGNVSRDTLLQCLRILNRFKEQLRGWAIEPDHVTVISTSALREAKNRDAILDRIMVKTGFRVTAIDGIEENRLMYLAVLNCLSDKKNELLSKDSIIIEIGGGSTEIMLLEQGKMAAAHSLRLGTVIIEQHLKTMMGTQEDGRRFLEEYVRNTSGSLSTELNFNNVSQFITVGLDARIAATISGNRISGKLWHISRSQFNAFVHDIEKYSVEEFVERFKIPFSDAKSTHIGLLLNNLFINMTNAEEILVPDTNIREGLVISKIAIPGTGMESFFSQTVESARNLLRKYRGDENHAEYVRMISIKLFDALKTELGLDANARLMLEVAAILHDIGRFINPENHQIHSQYIISHSDIFGLSHDALRTVALVCKNHKSTNLTRVDEIFSLLPRNDRITILKLSAILKVADGLDRSHTQRIRDFSISFHQDTMIIRCKGTHATLLEKIAVSEKGDLFESVSGYSIILV